MGGHSASVSLPTLIAIGSLLLSCGNEIAYPSYPPASETGGEVGDPDVTDALVVSADPQTITDGEGSTVFLATPSWADESGFVATLNFEDGALATAFVPAPGGWTARVTWDMLHVNDPIDFIGTSRVRTLYVVVLSAGRRAEATVTITLRCGIAACAGTCISRWTEDACGSCDPCRAGAVCEEGECVERCECVRSVDCGSCGLAHAVCVAGFCEETGE